MGPKCAINADLFDARNCGRMDSRYCAQQKKSDKNTGWQPALASSTLSDEQPRNTKRGADCHLTLPDRSTGEQKVDDVEAGNQQNETDATSTRSSFCTRPVT